MKTTAHRFIKPVWFKKWNRKAYSMFRSLGVVVHISKLSASVADQSLLKTSSAGLEAAFQSVADFGSTSEFAKKQDELTQETNLLEQILFAIQPSHISCAPAVDQTFRFGFLNFNSIYKGLVPVSLFFS